MLTFGALPSPEPDPGPTSRVCFPTGTCIPLSGGISEGGLIVLGVIGILILVLAIIAFVAFRYGNVILSYVKATQAEAAEAKREAVAAKTAAAGAQESITNNHQTHVRDDIDGNQIEIVALVKALMSTVDRMSNDVGGMRSEMRDVRRIAGEDRRRVNDLDARLTQHVDAAE